LPCVYLIDIEARQIEHLILKFQKTHFAFCFYFAANIVHFGNETNTLMKFEVRKLI
jgi:hypothetical protein